jgi:hypothetical protein
MSMNLNPFKFYIYYYSHQIKPLFFLLLTGLFFISLFCISGFKGFASQSISKEDREMKIKDVEKNTKGLLAKEESFQIERVKKEKLSYDIYWLGIYAGKAVLEAVNDKGDLRITSQAHSAPFISVFYKVEDYAESLIRDGRAVHFRIKQREGRYRSDKETIFDINNNKVIYFDYLKSKKSEHSIESLLWDVISGFYYLRTQPLVIGEVIYINVFDSNKFLKTEVAVLRKEKIKISGSSEIATVVVKPDLKSEGLFHKKGDIFIWLTDDEKRIPVRIETKVPIGKVVAELKNAEIEK